MGCAVQGKLSRPSARTAARGRGTHAKVTTRMLRRSCASSTYAGAGAATFADADIMKSVHVGAGAGRR